MGFLDVFLGLVSEFGFRFDIAPIFGLMKGRIWQRAPTFCSRVVIDNDNSDLLRVEQGYKIVPRTSHVLGATTKTCSVPLLVTARSVHFPLQLLPALGNVVVQSAAADLGNFEELIPEFGKSVEMMNSLHRRVQ